MGTKKISYGFEFDDGTIFIYDLQLDAKTLSYIPKGNIKDEEWTNLDYHQCENCPLTKGDCAKCPVANNLNEVIQITKDKISYEKAKIVVKTDERTYAKSTSLQDGLFSLFGIIMATSGCPHLDWLKPMVKFHLPFATVQETLFRSVSMYLLKQFLLSRKNKEHDFTAGGLLKKYGEIEKVNQGILDRINSFVKGDADKNALVTLNIFAQMFACEFENDFDLLMTLYPDLNNNEAA